MTELLQAYHECLNMEVTLADAFTKSNMDFENSVLKNTFQTYFFAIRKELDALKKGVWSANNYKVEAVKFLVSKFAEKNHTLQKFPDTTDQMYITLIGFLTRYIAEYKDKDKSSFVNLKNAVKKKFEKEYKEARDIQPLLYQNLGQLEYSVRSTLIILFEYSDTMENYKKYIQALTRERYILAYLTKAGIDLTDSEKVYASQLRSEIAMANSCLKELEGLEFSGEPLPEYLIFQNTKMNYVNLVDEKIRYINSLRRKDIGETDCYALFHNAYLNQMIFSLDRQRIVAEFGKKEKEALSFDEQSLLEHLKETVDRELFKTYEAVFQSPFITYFGRLEEELKKNMLFILSSKVFGDEQYEFIKVYHKLYRYELYHELRGLTAAEKREKDRLLKILWDCTKRYVRDRIKSLSKSFRSLEHEDDKINDINSMNTVMLYTRAGRLRVSVYDTPTSINICDTLPDMYEVEVESVSNDRYSVNYLYKGVAYRKYIPVKDVLIDKDDRKKKRFPTTGYCYIGKQYDPYVSRVTTFFKNPILEQCGHYIQANIQNMKPYMSKYATRVVRALRKLKADGISDSDITVELIATVTGIDSNGKNVLAPLTPKEVAMTLDAMRNSRHVSLDAPIKDDKDNDVCTIGESIASDQYLDGESEYIAAEFSDELFLHMDELLTDQERLVLMTKVFHVRNKSINQDDSDTAYNQVSKLLGIPARDVKKHYSNAVSKLQACDDLRIMHASITQRADIKDNPHLEMSEHESTTDAVQNMYIEADGEEYEEVLLSEESDDEE